MPGLPSKFSLCSYKLMYSELLFLHLKHSEHGTETVNMLLMHLLIAFEVKQNTAFTAKQTHCAENLIPLDTDVRKALLFE